MKAMRATAPARKGATSRPRLEVLDRRTAPRRTPAAVVAVLGVVSLFLGLFGIVAFQAFLVQTQGKLDDANRQVAIEEERAKELRFRVAELGAPERVLDAARERLGMIPPTDVRYLQPRPDDDARAAFDPARDAAPVPTTTVPTATTTPSTTVKRPTATTTPPTTVKRPTATTTPSQVRR